MAAQRAYWTILIGESPTAFRAREAADLQPTLVQLQRTQPNAVLKWFEHGRLWASPTEAADNQRTARRDRRDRDRDWRPGGTHVDVGLAYKRAKQAKWDRLRGKHRPHPRSEGDPESSGDRPRAPRADRPWRPRTEQATSERESAPPSDQATPPPDDRTRAASESGESRPRDDGEHAPASGRPQRPDWRRSSERPPSSDRPRRPREGDDERASRPRSDRPPTGDRPRGPWRPRGEGDGGGESRPRDGERAKAFGRPPRPDWRRSADRPPSDDRPRPVA